MTQPQQSSWKEQFLQSTVVNTAVKRLAVVFVIGFLVYGILVKQDVMYDFKGDY